MNTHLATLRGQPARLHRLSGFTLIEMMVTLGLAALLMGLAAPALMDVNRKFRINGLSASITSGLQTARAEAIKGNAAVIVCARNTAGTDCATTADWGARGWMVCYDMDSNGGCDSSTTTRLNPILTQQAVDPGIAAVTGPSAGVRFDALGRRPVAAGTATVTVEGSWDGAPTLTTTIAATGLIKGKRL